MKVCRLLETVQISQENETPGSVELQLSVSSLQTFGPAQGVLGFEVWLLIELTFQQHVTQKIKVPSKQFIDFQTLEDG